MTPDSDGVVEVAAWTDARTGVTCTGHPYEVYPGTSASFDVAYPVAY